MWEDSDSEGKPSYELRWGCWFGMGRWDGVYFILSSPLIVASCEVHACEGKGGSDTAWMDLLEWHSNSLGRSCVVFCGGKTNLLGKQLLVRWVSELVTCLCFIFIYFFAFRYIAFWKLPGFLLSVLPSFLRLSRPQLIYLLLYYIYILSRTIHHEPIWSWSPLGPRTWNRQSRTWKNILLPNTSISVPVPSQFWIPSGRFHSSACYIITSMDINTSKWIN